MVTLDNEAFHLHVIFVFDYSILYTIMVEEYNSRRERR